MRGLAEWWRELRARRRRRLALRPDVGAQMRRGGGSNNGDVAGIPATRPHQDSGPF